MLYWVAANPQLQQETGVKVVPARVEPEPKEPPRSPPKVASDEGEAAEAVTALAAAPPAPVPAPHGHPAPPPASVVQTRPAGGTRRVTPAAFYVQELGKFYHGAVIAGLLREAMSLAGLELKLPGWDAIRKHLSGQKTKRWTNPTKGGNRGAIALLFLPCCGRRFSLLSC